LFYSSWGQRSLQIRLGLQERKRGTGLPLAGNEDFDVAAQLLLSSHQDRYKIAKILFLKATTDHALNLGTL
jgi:hypothetical protein